MSGTFTSEFAGQVNVKPRLPRLNAPNDSLAVITTAGYLNSSPTIANNPPQNGDFVFAIYNGGQGIFTVSITAGVITLAAFSNGGEVSLIGTAVSGNIPKFSGTTGDIADSLASPSDATKTKFVMAGSAVQVGYLAHFTDVSGTVDDTAGAVINAGTIQSGLAGTVGGFIAYPPTAGNGFLELLAINAGGAFNTIISNSAMLQSSTISIPDPGAATAKFLLSALAAAGVQHITAGSLQVDAGGLLAGLATGGTAGSLTLYPATTANGSFVLSPVGNVGNFAATLSNVVGLGQASVYTLPDPGNAVARVLVGATATPFTTAHILASSGTGGLVADSGIATSAVQLNTNIKAASTADIGGGGAGPISVVVAGLTSASKIVATIASSSNVVAVAKCIATATGFDITFTADPGAACVVNYVAFVVAQ